MKQFKFVVIASLSLTAAAATPIAFAQNYPTKSVRLFVTLGPGSASDILARLVADELGKRMGQSFIVENRPGAGGNIAADATAKSAPDGYTIMLATVSSHAINASLYKQLPYDPVRDFAPIALLASNPNVLVVAPNLGVNHVRELVDLAKRKPGELSYASGGSGTSQHLSGELLATLTGIKLTHVPFKSTPEAVNSVLGGQVTMTFASVPVAIGQVRGGKLKALGVTTIKPLQWWSDVPTLASQGITGFDVSAWFGLAAPAGTPDAIIQRLSVEANQVIALPAVRDKLNAQGMEVLGGTSAEFAAHIKSEIDRWARIVKASGASVD